jgi:class 3 adenylate cyclase
MPSTLFFTGHMIDRLDRAVPRFPPASEPTIARRIAEELEQSGATDGFASGACGGDLLFLEAMLARGGRVHVALPCAIEAFRRDCVEIVPGGGWSERFHRVIRAATTVEILGEQYASDNAMASECCSRVLVGLAERCAAGRREQAGVLALWDGRPGDAAGGTHSIIDYCLRLGYAIRWMTDLRPAPESTTRSLLASAAGTTSAIRHAATAPEAPQEICAVIFADAVGFSKLSEREVPAFTRHYLQCAMTALQEHEIVPLVKNTWGDGLYLVFGSVREAGLFALGFRDRIVSADWREIGLDHGMSVRIGVHAGPLFRIYDPVIGQWSYTGAHVTRAARLEPTTDPGRVFATLTFAALAAAERVHEFSCAEVGFRQLVKNAGGLKVFELQRTP